MYVGCNVLSGVVFNLGMLADMVLANQFNCQRLCLLGKDVLLLLDNAGAVVNQCSSSRCWYKTHAFTAASLTPPCAHLINPTRPCYHCRVVVAPQAAEVLLCARWGWRRLQPALRTSVSWWTHSRSQVHRTRIHTHAHSQAGAAGRQKIMQLWHCSPTSGHQQQLSLATNTVLLPVMLLWRLFSSAPGSAWHVHV